VSELLKFPLEDGGAILVEVDRADERATRRGGVEDRVIEVGQTLEHVLGRVAPMVKSLVERFDGPAGTPTDVELEFGVKLSADASVIVARTSGEASFRLLVRWSGRPGA
jgi:hypothetical protein